MLCLHMSLVTVPIATNDVAMVKVREGGPGNHSLQIVLVVSLHVSNPLTMRCLLRIKREGENVIVMH